MDVWVSMVRYTAGVAERYPRYIHDTRLAAARTEREAWVDLFDFLTADDPQQVSAPSNAEIEKELMRRGFVPAVRLVGA